MKAGRYIGLCFENGYGVAPDAQLAAHWYQAASLRGDVTATYLLGTALRKRQGRSSRHTKSHEPLPAVRIPQRPCFSPQSACLGTPL